MNIKRKLKGYNVHDIKTITINQNFLQHMNFNSSNEETIKTKKIY